MLAVFIRLRFILLYLFLAITSNAQHEKSKGAVLFPFEPVTATHVSNSDSNDTFQPLQVIGISGANGSTITVTDGAGKQYTSMPVQPLNTFVVRGALGRHTVHIYNKAHQVIAQLPFTVDARTSIDDNGYYKQMFDLFYNGMWDKPGQVGSVTWNGKLYHYFVPWSLDHFHTGKGLKYFSPYESGLVDLMRTAQRADGMIWSFVQYMPNVDYWLTRDKYTGYSRRIGDKVFVRQPTENHPEYIFVNTIYQCWKATGDTAWMQQNLDAAERALNYSMNDPARWSKRFGLLKRVYTIDSWDFQVEDEYLPDLGITNSMIIDSVKSKFGIFFGDNTGYISACYHLAEMLERAGRHAESKLFRERGAAISDRLNKLAWNGNFFTHFIEEDSTVKRHLGVEEKTQVAQSNAYSLNLDISATQKKAIIETYLDLKNHLPVGSPGEWYAIYPPFQRGFGQHDAIWQYMNGGVGGHVAGELARGAYEAGYENYGTDILNRLFELGKKYDNKIYFAYTGSLPPPPPVPVYKPVYLSHYANMDFWNKGSNEAKPWMLVKRGGDDFHNLPTGTQTFQNIRFNVINPEENNRKAVIAVSHQQGFPTAVEVPVNDTASCVYLLHTSSKPASENVAGSVTFLYADGSRNLNYMMMGKHLSYWWFSQLATDHSGIAWYGKNDVSEGIGLSWCALDNPEPQKKIAKIIFEAPADSSIYTVFAVTLADRTHYVPVNPVSFGGPDNWAAATAMAAMVEGLAGVKDGPGTEAFSAPVIAPRWVSTQDSAVAVSIRYAASKGYVAYQFKNDSKNRNIYISTTGSATHSTFHVLLPNGATVQRIRVHAQSIPFKQTKIKASAYADFEVALPAQQDVVIEYK